MASQRDRFLADTFHEAAIARDDPGLVVDQVVAKARVLFDMLDEDHSGDIERNEMMHVLQHGSLKD